VAPVGVEAGFEKGYINYCQVYAKTLAMPLWTGAVCIPRPIFNEMQGFPNGIKLGEDFLLWIRIALKYKVAFLNNPLAYYNQDVDADNRLTGRLVAPDKNYLWQLDYLTEVESQNIDYKQLIDGLRCYDLRPYYLSREYNIDTFQEIKKVDFTKQSFKVRCFYKLPLFAVRMNVFIHTICYKAYIKMQQIAAKLVEQCWEVGLLENDFESVMNGELSVKWIETGYKDRWFADPFILDVNDAEVKILVEEYFYNEKKGRIAEITIERCSNKLIKNKTLLDIPTHLSFPAIWREKDTIYVYPENSASGSLFLYRYTENGLVFDSILGIEPLTDAIMTDFFAEHRLYSTCMPSPNGNDLGLYLLDKGVFHLAKIIKFSNCDARMAGDFFKYKNKIYKPSQDCSRRYGGAIRIYETEDGISFNYKVTLTSPHPSLKLGLHTINSFKGVTVVDAVGYRYSIAGKIISALIFIKKKLH
jgi:hypothetical protein